MALFRDFQLECLPLFSLNFGSITLLLKVDDAKQIQQYRLICVLNVSFKIFIKDNTNRLKQSRSNCDQLLSDDIHGHSHPS